MLKKSGTLQLYRGSERFDVLGGLQSLKSFCLRSMRMQGHQNPLRRPRGVLLLGVPGTGKSAFRKALGAETGRPTLIMDVGALMGSLVGRRRPTFARPCASPTPCRRAITDDRRGGEGAVRRGSGSGDSGVSARLFGTFLTWLNDRTSDVYVDLHLQRHQQVAAGVRSRERFDGICTSWTCPAAQQKKAIWDIYLETVRAWTRSQPRPKDESWTGAEDQGLLPAGGSAGRAADGRCSERRARGCHGRRIGRTAAELGYRPLPGCRGRRHLRRPMPAMGSLVKPGRKVRRDPSNN